MGLVLLAACSPFQLLRPKQRLLSRVELRGVEQADKDRLEALAQQHPNTRFPLPKLAIYQLGYRFYDSARIKTKLNAIQRHYEARMKAASTDSATLGKLLIQRERKVNRKQLTLDKGNAIMRLGEAPVVYDSALTRRSVAQMTTYLHAQGFFRARVASVDTARYERGVVLKALTAVGKVLPGKGGKSDSLDAAKRYKRVTVTYHITENQPFLYRLQSPSIPDSGVAAVVRGAQDQSLLHENERYNEDAIGRERLRLESLLKNSGYFDFRQQYITLEADTSYAPFTVRLRTIIANPAPGQGHRVYTLNQVRFVTDAGVSRTLRAATGDTLRRAGTAGALRARPSLGVRTDTVVTDSIHFAAYQQQYNTSLLARKVGIRPGQLYSLDRTTRTQRMLSDLDMFRFNTVNYRKVPDPPSVDSTSAHPTSGQLIAIINASPASKYYEISELGGTFVATKVGPFVNIRLRNRNPFGGAELLELGVRLGLEGQLQRTADGEVDATLDAVYAIQLGATASLILPQFLMPFHGNRFLTKYNPKTRITLSETYVNRPEYTRSNFEFAFDYVWQKSQFHQFVFSPFVITLVNSKTEPYYDALLETYRQRGSSLFRSFKPLIEPSFSFTSLYNSNDFNQTRDARFLRLFIEFGGITRGLYKDSLYAKTGLNVYDFGRFSADYRRYHRLSPQTYFVWRMNGGVVHALTRSEGQYEVPYDKSFFGGGSTSLRAWQPRRLGLGSYTTMRTVIDPITLLREQKRDYIIEQPGELLLEASAEYRFPIYDFIKGAVFTDFGNVWGLQEKKDIDGKFIREGAQFQLNRFYKQIAADAGFGVRFDFTFLILRLDLAAKIYDPAAPVDKWALRNLDTRANEISFNLGIGYPF